VLETREGFLSDYEVYQQISAAATNSRKRRGTKDQPGNLQTVQLEVIHTAQHFTNEKLKNYFDRQAPHVQYQTEESVTRFLSLINDFKLTKVEKLMILNSRPTSLAALHVLIEEHEDRFSMDDMNMLLKYVKDCFPVPGE
jgi:RNA polymerase Rpb4